jgi:hypothetical protein
MHLLDNHLYLTQLQVNPGHKALRNNLYLLLKGRQVVAAAVAKKHLPSPHWLKLTQPRALLTKLLKTITINNQASKKPT